MKNYRIDKDKIALCLKAIIGSRTLYKYYFPFILLILILPLIIEVFYIRSFGVNVVYWDQWELVPLLDKLYDSSLTFDDLFAQHNEHRIFFPRIIMLGLAYMTQYNTIAEMFFSWELCIVISAIVFEMYRKDYGISISSMMPIPSLSSAPSHWAHS